MKDIPNEFHYLIKGVKYVVGGTRRKSNISTFNLFSTQTLCRIGPSESQVYIRYYVATLLIPFVC